jgi:hypothetical protein
MTNYGNNITAIATKGRLVYIDEPTYEAPDDLNDFDESVLNTRETFLDQFGIDAIYRPGVLSREITVIIKHLEDASQASPGIRHRSPLIQIKTANDSAIGIAADEFEQGQTISCPPRKGSAARLFRLTRIIKQTTVWVWYESK